MHLKVKSKNNFKNNCSELQQQSSTFGNSPLPPICSAPSSGMGVGSSLGIIASWRFFSLLSISFVSWTTLDQNSSSTFLIKSSSCLSALSLKYHHYNQHSRLLFPLLSLHLPSSSSSSNCCTLLFGFQFQLTTSSFKYLLTLSFAFKHLPTTHRNKAYVPTTAETTNHVDILFLIWLQNTKGLGELQKSYVARV